MLFLIEKVYAYYPQSASLLLNIEATRKEQVQWSDEVRLAVLRPPVQISVLLGHV